ncbi:MAG: hypothetical protein AAGC71_07045 [Pseudomonadota bacterium]
MNRSAQPPWLAVMLIRLLAPKVDREVILGDLAETFLATAEANPAQARADYWRDVARSAPYLALSRVRHWSAVRRVALAVVGALLITTLWDYGVSRNTAYWLATRTEPLPLITIRSLYFVLFGLGSVLAGLWAGALLIRRNDSLATLLVQRLLPVTLLIVGCSLALMIATTSAAAPYVITKTLVAVATILLGASIVVPRRRRD